MYIYKTVLMKRSKFKPLNLNKIKSFNFHTSKVNKICPCGHSVINNVQVMVNKQMINIERKKYDTKPQTNIAILMTIQWEF